MYGLRDGGLEEDEGLDYDDDFMDDEYEDLFDEDEEEED
jgi:hypothetical protein